jgi:hypothetical protein
MSLLQGGFSTLPAGRTGLAASGTASGFGETTGDAAALLDAEREPVRPSAVHDATNETEPSTNVRGDSQWSSTMTYDSTGCRELVDAIGPGPVYGAERHPS